MIQAVSPQSGRLVLVRTSPVYPASADSGEDAAQGDDLAQVALAEVVGVSAAWAPS